MSSGFRFCRNRATKNLVAKRNWDKQNTTKSCVFESAKPDISRSLNRFKTKQSKNACDSVGGLRNLDLFSVEVNLSFQIRMNINSIYFVLIFIGCDIKPDKSKQVFFT